MDLKDKKLVIFDFDGVLVNTLNFYFKFLKEKNTGLTWEKFQDFSNGNLWDNLKKVVAEESFLIPSDRKERYENEIKNLNIHEVLDKIIQILSSEYLLVIISSSPDKAIENFLMKEKIDKCFKEVLGSDIHENKVVKIKSVLDKYYILPENSVFITDSLGDILEGNECGIKSIGVTWGIHGKVTLEKGNPATIVDDPKELLEEIKNVLK